MIAVFDSAPFLAGLKGFQRDTVDHVDRRFYDDDPPARHFLVADETGLGKSMVARGLIARVVERLQHDSAVDRIDIIYVCSNADIARQNLERLDVLDTGAIHSSTRLTLLARDSGALDGDPHPDVGKRVNLVSFTPGTSFNLGNSTGRRDERALLHVILCEALGLTTITERRAAAVVLQGGAGLKSFQWSIDSMLWTLGDAGADHTIVKRFLAAIRTSGLRRRFDRAVSNLGRRTKPSADEVTNHRSMVGELRAALARAGVDALQPDLIILDEFQRFRHLLDLDDPSHREAAELAHALFDHGDAKVLLLSATPYKPFTYAEEASAGDDHEADLRRILGFLANGDEPAVSTIIHDLSGYRRAVIDGADIALVRGRLETSLTRLMCRTERPRLGDDGMLAEHADPLSDISEDDIIEFTRLRRLACDLETPIPIEYWKSIPYFANFGDGYQFSSALRAALEEPDERVRLELPLRAVQHLDADAVRHLDPIDPGNARMRKILADTVGQGSWQLLWMPPSLPYHEPRWAVRRPRRSRDDQAADLLVMDGNANSDRVDRQPRSNPSHRTRPKDARRNEQPPRLVDRQTI